MKRLVTVKDRMQKGYKYQLVAPIGRNFDPEFDPDLTPKDMLRLGVFGGKYMTDCRKEFPRNWFVNVHVTVCPAWRLIEAGVLPVPSQVADLSVQFPPAAVSATLYEPGTMAPLSFCWPSLNRKVVPLLYEGVNVKC